MIDQTADILRSLFKKDLQTFFTGHLPTLLSSVFLPVYLYTGT